MFSDPGYQGPYFFQKNPALNGNESGLTDADRRQVNDLYDGALHSIDAAIDKIITHLKRTGRWDRTIVVVTADHGEDLFDGDKLQGHGEHLRGENVLRVPFIVKFPGKKPPSREPVTFVTRAIDIAPTLLGLIGATAKGFSGRDYSSWMRNGGSAPAAEYAYAETEIWFSRNGNGSYQKQRLDYPGISGLLTFDAGYSGEVILNPKYENMMITSRHRALISSRWKLIYVPTAEGIQWELYDRIEDPHSLRNCIEREPAVARSMQNELLKLIEHLEPRAKLVGGYVIPR